MGAAVLPRVAQTIGLEGPQHRATLCEAPPTWPRRLSLCLAVGPLFRRGFFIRPALPPQQL
jgi:hypothetical protein